MRNRVLGLFVLGALMCGHSTTATLDEAEAAIDLPLLGLWLDHRFTDLNQHAGPVLHLREEVDFETAFCFAVVDIWSNTSERRKHKVFQQMSGIDQNA